MRIRFDRVIVASIVFLALYASSAGASAIITLDGVTPSIVYPGYYEWAYTITVDPSDGLQDAYVTIYDFGPIFTASAAWNVDTNLVGVTPGGLSPVDDPLIQNITFVSDLNQPGGTFPGQVLYSAVGTIMPGIFAWQDQDAYPTGNLQSGVGTVSVPYRDAAPPVPEPALLSLAAIGIGAALRRQRRRTGQTADARSGGRLL